jgi:hypothetical protein
MTIAGVGTRDLSAVPLHALLPYHATMFRILILGGLCLTAALVIVAVALGIIRGQSQK